MKVYTKIMMPLGYTEITCSDNENILKMKLRSLCTGTEY